MDNLNHNIDQKQIIPIRVLKEEGIVTDLELFEEWGNKEYESGNESEAMEWYTKGLAVARQRKQVDKITRFTHLILASI